jgi:hypothetical protein
MAASRIELRRCNNNDCMDRCNKDKERLKTD